MSGRPKAEPVLTEVEQEQLMALTLRRKTAQALALRARIVLACAQGADNKCVFRPIVTSRSGIVTDRSGIVTGGTLQG